MNDHNLHYQPWQQQDDDCETALDLSLKPTPTKRSKNIDTAINYDQPPNKRKKNQPRPFFDIDDQFNSDNETTSTTPLTIKPTLHQIIEQVTDDEPLKQQPAVTGKKQMRFQCKFCTFRSHSVSLMQNHIYRHIDTTPYSCFYCGHKSTTKSTIMVHIELCHPNVEVKIKENRVKEDDYYLDLNNGKTTSQRKTPLLVQTQHPRYLDCENKFQIIPSKCQHGDEKLFNELNSTEETSSLCCVSPAVSPNIESQNEIEVTTVHDESE
jgi:hypothetical protein